MMTHLQCNDSERLPQSLMAQQSTDLLTTVFSRLRAG